MKKLSKANTRILDARYVSYDPEQLIVGPESWIPVVCPVHGPYEVQVKYLKAMHCYRNLKAPQCPKCKQKHIPDREIMDRVVTIFGFLADCKLFGDEYRECYPEKEPADGWVPLPHWNPPNLNR